MNRTIKIKKIDLLDAIKTNKEAHIKDYDEAVIAFKQEAIDQLNQLQVRVVQNELDDITLDLVTPVDNTETYDENIKLFEWEVKDEIEITKEEFDEYVLDKSHVTSQAYFMNATYK